MQSRLAACVRHLYIQIELAPAQRAEVRYRPSKPTQMQHRLGKTRGLPQCQAKQVLERQTKLDCCIRELPTASAFATCRGKPAHTLVQPHRQRASSFEGCVVLLPVASSIAGFAGLTHAASLPLEEQRFMQQRRAALVAGGRHGPPHAANAARGVAPAARQSQAQGFRQMVTKALASVTAWTACTVCRVRNSRAPASSRTLRASN